MKNKGKGKRLNENERKEIIYKLSSPNPPSKRSIGREYGVSDTAIRKIVNQKDFIPERTALMSEQIREETFRFSKGKFTQIEEKLYDWINSMRLAKLAVPPSLAKEKAAEIAEELNITKEQFKASWQWLSNFRSRYGINNMSLHGEEAEVDKNDPVLLESLNKLYNQIKEYKCDNVYNMDECGLFFRMLPRYTLLMPSEDISSTRGKKNKRTSESNSLC